MKIQTAEQVLRKYYTPLYRSWIVDISVELAMKEYAAQFIDLAANSATLKELRGQEFQESNDSVTNSYGDSYGVDKESILNLKEQIK